jgi:hypothetical protein
LGPEKLHFAPAPSVPRSLLDRAPKRIRAIFLPDKITGTLGRAIQIWRSLDNLAIQIAAQNNRKRRCQFSYQSQPTGVVQVVVIFETQIHQRQMATVSAGLALGILQQPGTGILSREKRFGRKIFAWPGSQRLNQIGTLLRVIFYYQNSQGLCQGHCSLPSF